MYFNFWETIWHNDIGETEGDLVIGMDGYFIIEEAEEEEGEVAQLYSNPSPPSWTFEWILILLVPCGR